jgi:hypothetical protein
MLFKMTLRNFLRIVFALLMLFAIAIGLISINHPIILKWVTGSARHHGQPIPATVYTDGNVNEHVKVFYTDEENNYLLSLGNEGSAGALKFINLDLNKKSIGTPVETSSSDYDLIAGHLFQSKTAVKFSPFHDEMNGSTFDPQLTFFDGEIRFIMPHGNVTFDSVRIILP